MPSDVNGINCVTHVALNNAIVVEWTKIGESSYHVVTINTDSLSITQDFMTDDNTEVQMMLTWVDGGNILGRFSGRGFDEFTTINLAQSNFTAKASTSAGEIQTVQSGHVNTYNIPVNR